MAIIDVDLVSPRLRLDNLKRFAQFLLDGHVEEFVQKWLELTRSYEIPLLRHLNNYTEEQITQIGRAVTCELLQSLVSGTVEEYIRISVGRWIENQLPLIEKNQIDIDDVSLFPHVRKQTLLSFLPRYTTDTFLILDLVREIDDYTLAHTTSSYKTFLKIIEDHLASQLKQLEQSDRLFKQAQAITHLGNYTWDIKSDKLIWTDELYRIYGLTPGTPLTQQDIVS